MNERVDVSISNNGRRARYIGIKNIAIRRQSVSEATRVSEYKQGGRIANSKKYAMNSWNRKGWISLKPYNRDSAEIEKDRTIGRSERIGK